MFLRTTLSLIALWAVLATAGSPAPASADEFPRLVRELHVRSQPWAAIPWQTSVSEARAAAAAEGKPIFLIVNTGNCLGFV